MPGKEQLERELASLKQKYGDWVFDIPLPCGVWTRGNLQVPHTRLKRIVQVVSDLSAKPISESRILDLGCLDGLFSIEFAKQGATTVGVEVREANIKKAIFSKEALGLHNLEFRQDDVRNVSLASYGTFDAIICSGILYHLEAADAIHLVKSMYGMVSRVVVIDTHVALEPKVRIECAGEEYWGSVFQEFRDGATADFKAKRLLAAADNSTSFWFTRPSLVNILTKAGFSSVYECFTPAHLNFGNPGFECLDRCTFVAVKDATCDLMTSPAANLLQEKWPEGALAYTPARKNGPQPGAARRTTTERQPFLTAVRSRLKRMLF